ncbi:MAG TPA: hypothetical protein PKD72_10255, partial [Gemmatales bacterium]|nr:hypothetical protein [Gemmatales bacterium]
MSPETIHKPFLRRFWVPITLIVICVLLELVIWNTNLMAEVILPQFASSAQSVAGRSTLILFGGLLLIWLIFTRQLAAKVKYGALGIIALVAAAFAASIRSIENTGNNNYVFHFRWEPTQDERLAAFLKNLKPTDISSLDPNAPSFTDFLGAQRNGFTEGAPLLVEAIKKAPKELWRRPVGGGYASFVLAGGLAVTIEQRGEEEMIVALDLKTGSERWTRGYPGHFKENLGGNG